MNFKEFLKSQENNVFVIAEIGVNHEGDLDLAKQMILDAKNNGADAVKFQTYKAEKIASQNSPGYWDFNEESTRSQFELFKKYDSFNISDYKALKDFSDSIEIEFMSTPFDLEAVDIVDDLVRVFKISSSDITNIPLLKKIAKTNKPIILSTGASNVDEIDHALRIIREINSEIPISLLHCVLEYPTPNSNANLSRIGLLKERYFASGITIGYSDHTFPDPTMLNCTIAVSLGARIIEKHFTFDKSLKGNDHYHSMDGEDLQNLSKNIKAFFKIFGNAKAIDYNESEDIARKNARRGVYTSKYLKKGSILKESDLICKRPTTDFKPADIDSFLIGKTLKTDLKNDHPISSNDLM